MLRADELSPSSLPSQTNRAPYKPSSGFSSAEIAVKASLFTSGESANCESEWFPRGYGFYSQQIKPTCRFALAWCLHFSFFLLFISYLINSFFLRHLISTSIILVPFQGLRIYHNRFTTRDVCVTRTWSRWKI